MSVRRQAPGAFSRATPPGKVASSRRLDEVLRAGTVVGTPVDESGLTRALKQASVTPTGACVPRTFDPDYCAYDQYYAVGVADTTATLGVLAETGAVKTTANAAIRAVREALGRQCHVPEAEGWTWTKRNPQAKRFDQMAEIEKGDAREKFSFLCASLDDGLRSTYLHGDAYLMGAAYQLKNMPLGNVAVKLIEMIIRPAEGVSTVASHFLDGGASMARGAEYREYERDMTLSGESKERIDDVLNGVLRRYEVADGIVVNGVFLASVAWILKYVSRYLNEHALMVASFFRVNAKRLDNGEPALLNLAKFVQMCKDDIADGANPPPEPPELPEAEARRLAELRARREARDPFMEGLDYPETYASARDA